ncbi:MAG: hypothetical protein WCS85_04970 [Candidatus Peribacteraceae bacterium]
MLRVQKIIGRLFHIVEELERRFPGRHFTLDGHIVGSLGEVFAEERYKLTLLPSSNKTHDARKGSRLIQIKATQRGCVAISSEPQHLIVLKLQPTGVFEEVYNGPGDRVWHTLKGKKRPKNGQYQVRLSTLRSIMQGVSGRERIV